MALSRFNYPYLSSRDWWDNLDYPSSSRLFDQHFGSGLLESDLMSPALYRGYVVRPRSRLSMESSGQSEVVFDKDKFQVLLNVSQFNPEELEVKTVDNCITVHGRHEERSDEHGFVSREFTRRYMLPEGVDPETVSSSLSAGGMLTLKAPRKSLEPLPKNQRIVPITMQQPPAPLTSGVGEQSIPVTVTK